MHQHTQLSSSREKDLKWWSGSRNIDVHLTSASIPALRSRGGSKRTIYLLCEQLCLSQDTHSVSLRSVCLSSFVIYGHSPLRWMQNDVRDREGGLRKIDLSKRGAERGIWEMGLKEKWVWKRKLGLSENEREGKLIGTLWESRLWKETLYESLKGVFSLHGLIASYESARQHCQHYTQPLNGGGTEK